MIDKINERRQRYKISLLAASNEEQKSDSKNEELPSGSYYSFEFFPPKTEAGLNNLLTRIDRMTRRLDPLFIDVTWGSAGSTSARTLAMKSQAQRYYGVDVLMHLTTTGMARDQLASILEQAKACEIHAATQSSNDKLVALVNRVKMWPPWPLSLLGRKEEDEELDGAVTAKNTYPRVKRAALNRDNSLASNRLKQEFMPEVYNTEMTQLSENFELSHLSPASAAKQLRPKPTSLADGGRVSTIDAISMDLMGKPAPMLVGNRVSTIDALDIDFDDDPIIRPGQSKEDCLGVLRQDLPQPLSLASDERLTTKDFMDLVNSTIVGDDRATGDTASEDEPLPLNQERNIAEEWMTKV
jgi:hypothetical protein